MAYLVGRTCLSYISLSASLDQLWNVRHDGVNIYTYRQGEYRQVGIVRNNSPASKCSGLGKRGWGNTGRRYDWTWPRSVDAPGMYE